MAVKVFNTESEGERNGSEWIYYSARRRMQWMNTFKHSSRMTIY